jgi:enoyl-CoA hydratase/carnithine racemase
VYNPTHGEDKSHTIQGYTLSSIEYEVRDRIAHITISGHNDLNILTAEMIAELCDVLEDFRDRPDASVAVISGAGTKAFSAGGDLKGPVTTHPDEFTLEGNRRAFWWPRYGVRAATGRMLNLDIDKPVIAAINGYCLGVALMMVVRLSDIRVAGDAASFGFTETQRGLCGGAAVAQLGNQIPHVAEMYMVLTGNAVSADEAQRFGLINFVVSPDQVIAKADEIAAGIAKIPIEVIKAEKEGALRARTMDRQSAWRLSNALYTIQVHESYAYKGAEDFLAKRPSGLGEGKAREGSSE